MFLEDLKLNAFNKMIGPVLPAEHIFILYLSSALILAIFTYLLARDDHEVYGPKNKHSHLWHQRCATNSIPFSHTNVCVAIYMVLSAD